MGTSRSPTPACCATIPRTEGIASSQKSSNPNDSTRCGLIKSKSERPHSRTIRSEFIRSDYAARICGGHKLWWKSFCEIIVDTHNFRIRVALNKSFGGMNEMLLLPKFLAAVHRNFIKSIRKQKQHEGRWECLQIFQTGIRLESVAGFQSDSIAEQMNHLHLYKWKVWLENLH